MPDRKDVPPGTLDPLILQILSRERMQGWGIMQIPHVVARILEHA